MQDPDRPVPLTREGTVIAIRHAGPDDAAAVGPLLEQLDYRVSQASLRDRLIVLGASDTDTVLIAATEGQVVGLIALHWTTMLHLECPTARITTLVVGEAARGRGVGRRLVEAGAAVAREAGCAVLELTTALHREDARAFYEAIGFTASSTRLHRLL